MSVFLFRAVDLAGVPSRGELEAGSKTQVTEQLRQRGLIVLDVSVLWGNRGMVSAFTRAQRLYLDGELEAARDLLEITATN